ncbi:hypothetical protein L0152_10715 [bacterium]|nr:hypothetical protein [bacterium]
MERHTTEDQLACWDDRILIHGDPVKNGFALVLSLMFLLVLTLLALILLLVSASYYASAHNLFENENARIACEQVTRLMVDTHNFDPAVPRFFHDPLHWQSRQLVPYVWNGYTVTGQLKSTWNLSAVNDIQVNVSKGRYNSSLNCSIDQIRLEDFALYLNDAQSLPAASLIDGRAFVANGLNLENPIVRFRDFVEGTISPTLNASFRKTTAQTINYPSLTSFCNAAQFLTEAQTKGLFITAQNPIFWNGSEYELNLDLFELQKQSGNRWRVLYNTIDLGIIRSLHIGFDNVVRIRQSYAQIPHLTDTKSIVPIYLSSVANVLLDSSVQSIESANGRHPLCIISNGSISITQVAPGFVRIQALLIAFGSSNHNGLDSSLILTPGFGSVSNTELDSWKMEIYESSFSVEADKRDSLLAILQNGGKAIWFRGSVALTGPIFISDDLDQIHFESSHFDYLFLPSFPFVKIVEGSQQWH